MILVDNLLAVMTLVTATMRSSLHVLVLSARGYIICGYYLKGRGASRHLSQEQ